ncbi:MAG TPA: hypothetical protein VMJ66_03620 [Geobacteraceae bacterium]|nr:hypothetical protein [Geobacteraceae bacterium]
MKKHASFAEHDILENPSSFGEDCFKKNEEMLFDVNASKQHGWCDEIKRGVAFRGEESTYVKPGSFSFSSC